MQKVGWILIIGVLIWIFVVTLPFIWWIWLLVLGFYFAANGAGKKGQDKVSSVDIKYAEPKVLNETKEDES